MDYTSRLLSLDDHVSRGNSVCVATGQDSAADTSSADFQRISQITDSRPRLHLGVAVSVMLCCSGLCFHVAGPNLNNNPDL